MSVRGLTPEQANDWMAIEPRLVELVKKAVAGLSPAVHVLTAADLSVVRESAQRVPAIHVVYGSFQVEQDMTMAWRLLHTWYVVAADRNVANVVSGQAARLSAGALLAHVVSQLAGEDVLGATKPLALMRAPPPQYSDGFQFIPSAFGVETVLQKINRS